jgi:hypothetical protein
VDFGWLSSLAAAPSIWMAGAWDCFAVSSAMFRSVEGGFNLFARDSIGWAALTSF